MLIKKDELSIYDVELLHKELIKEFENETIFINMKNVNKVDMSIIQLFISTQKSCLEDSKTFELQNISKDVLKTLKDCACDFLLGTDNG